MFDEQRSSPLTSQKAPSMTIRPVMTGRRILFNFLDKLGLQLGDKLEEQGWIYFCSLNTRTYPNLVHTFYENLIVGEEHIESRVKRKRIIFFEEILSSLLQMPYIGNKYLELECRKTTVQTIMERDDVNIVGTIILSSLSLEMRLLHKFIRRIFIPRIGRFDWVSERDLGFMERVIKEEAINLPFIMMSQIKEITRMANTCLPYGMVFTLIFEASHIDLTGQDSKQLHHIDTYTTKFLIRMGYYFSNSQ